MLKLQKSRTHNRQRTARGAYLLELLVAISVSGLFALALTQSITEGMRSTSASQNQVIATWLATEAMERIRITARQNSSFFDIPEGTNLQFKVNSNDVVIPNEFDFSIRPLLINFDQFNWIGKNGATDPSIHFQGKVTANITERLDSGKNVDIRVTWLESNSSQLKQYRLFAAVFRSL